MAEPHVLREYALLADGERGALLGPRGDVAWLCFPGWADDAVLAGLLGGGGSYAVTPAGRFVWGGAYEPRSLIWRSRWVTEAGIVECREALAHPGEGDRAVLLRRVIQRSGEGRLGVRLTLGADFGRRSCDDWRRDEGGWWRARLGEGGVAWWAGPGVRVRGDELYLDLDLREGDTQDLVLVLGCERDPPPADADVAWEGTEAAWRDRVCAFDHTAAPRDAAHAHAVLSGLTASSGALVAAATMSLPERAESGRSYDYRYAWIRDQCMAGQAAAAAGAPRMLDEAVRFVGARLLADGPALMPAYTVHGGRVPGEHSVGLPGYPGGADVAGNHVGEQFQLDAFGEALLLLADAAGQDRLDADGWRAAEVAAQAIEARWREPDAGLWELDPAHWTHSRLICAAGLRAIATSQPAGARQGAWTALADAMQAQAAAESTHPAGRWQRAPGDPRVDASLLLPGLRGGLAPGDPREQATLEAVLAELTQDGYCYRYRPDPRPLGEAEGAFLLCGFALSLALARHGRHLEAARWFDRNRSAAGPPGLLSEEFDVRQRQLRGNLPQAFVHAMLLQCAVSLAATA